MNSTTWMYYWRVFIWMVRLCANGRNNSQQYWDLQCIVGRIKPISLCKPCVMSVRGPNNVGRAVQTDPTLLRYASAITEQNKCWELLAEKFDRFQTLRNNTQQHPTTCNRVCKRTQHVTSNNVASVCSGLNTIGFHPQTQNWSEPNRKKVPFESTTEEV